MPTMVTIGGLSVDQDDPCALGKALYSAKLRLLAGERLEEVEVQSPATRRRMRVSGANLTALDAEIAALRAACIQSTGGTRTRYAKRIRFI